METQYTYLGQPCEVQTLKNVYLIKIDDKIVRVKKQVRVKKWPKLKVLQGGLR